MKLGETVTGCSLKETSLYIAAAAAAKSLQSCPTLWDPIDGSPPGSPVPGILQARTVEWGAMSFSNAWKWKVKVKSLSQVQLLATPWTAAHQAPPSMGFSRQEHWSGVPLPSLRCIWTSLNSLCVSSGFSWMDGSGCEQKPCLCLGSTGRCRLGGMLGPEMRGQNQSLVGQAISAARWPPPPRQRWGQVPRVAGAEAPGATSSKRACSPIQHWHPRPKPEQARGQSQKLGQICREFQSAVSASCRE